MSSKWIYSLSLVTAIGLAACATRLHGGVYDDDGGTGDDGSVVVVRDMTTPPPIEDMTIPSLPDQVVPGKTCGEIMKCVLGCGAMLGGCQLTCLQGASPEGAQEATVLIGCIVQNCIARPPSDGGMTDILLCAFSSCSNEIQMCKGFGF